MINQMVSVRGAYKAHWIYSLRNKNEQALDMVRFILLYFIYFLIDFLFLTMPRGMWDLSSLTRDQTRVPCSGSAES